MQNIKKIKSDTHLIIAKALHTDFFCEKPVQGILEVKTDDNGDTIIKTSEGQTIKITASTIVGKDANGYELNGFPCESCQKPAIKREDCCADCLGIP